MGKFTVEEINLMCVFNTKSRRELIEDIGRVLPHLKESEMEELARNVLTKLQDMTDEEFTELVGSVKNFVSLEINGSFLVRIMI